MKSVVSALVIAVSFVVFALHAPGWAQAPRPSQPRIGQSAGRRDDDYHRLQPSRCTRTHVVWIPRPVQAACGVPAPITARRFNFPRT